MAIQAWMQHSKWKNGKCTNSKVIWAEIEGTLFSHWKRMRDISKFANAFSKQNTYSTHSPVFCINDSVFILFWIRGIVHILNPSLKKILERNHKNSESIDSCWHVVYCGWIELVHFKWAKSFQANSLSMILVELSLLKLILCAYNAVDYVLNFSITQIGSGE